MSTVSVVPTVEPGNVPPRIRLDVTDTGSPNLFATTVTRLDPDGALRVVRTTDGNPLTLTTSGSNRVGFVYDYEAPFGSAVSYSTGESPATVSTEVTLDQDAPWLIHVGVPSLSKPVEFRVGTVAEETLSVRRGVHWPMGSRFPVVQTDGVRKAPESTLIVSTDSPQDTAAIRALIADASVLLLNVPTTLGLEIATCYISIGDVRIARPSDIGTDPYRDIVMPYLVVDQPVGGSQSGRTYVDLLTFSTYADLNAAYPTYADMLAGP